MIREYRKCKEKEIYKNKINTFVQDSSSKQISYNLF